MTKVKINFPIPPLEKGIVRVMYDDGDGVVCADFESGICNDLIRQMVEEFLKKSQF